MTSVSAETETRAPDSPHGSGRLRVLHAHSGNLFGGVETILVTLVRQRDHCPDLEMEFALCFQDRLGRDLSQAGAVVHDLGPVRVSRPWTLLRGRRALARLLRQQPFDVVVVHSAWSHAVFAPVARRAGKAVVWWLHNRAEGRHWSERWARLTKPDLLLCVSHSTAETTPNLFRNVEQEIIYAPMPQAAERGPAESRARTRAELQTPADAVVIIQVSRMEGWKGHALHLRALRDLRDLPNWVCWQVGGPSDRPEEVHYFAGLQQMARELGVADRVRFLGKRADVPRLLEAADVFCQPNLGTEGFSIAFMEALMAGLPVLTTAIGGAVELINESCGILVPLGDERALTQALRRLVQEPELCRRLGEGGPRRVQELCDPARQLRRLKDTFARVAGKRSAADASQGAGVRP